MTESFIDTRYPPEQSFTSVELYPDNLNTPHPTDEPLERSLESILAQKFTASAESIVVAGSASSLLREYVIAIGRSSRPDKLIALPHYSCQSIVDAIIDGGGSPVFYDIDNDTSISERAIEFTVNNGCDAFVWPTYFGASWRNELLIERLRDSSIDIIFDEAQANLFSIDAKQIRELVEPNEVVLYSFGVSKLLAGVGGGAIHTTMKSHHQERLREGIQKEPYRRLVQTPDTHKTTTQHFATQDQLLEARNHQGSEHLRISEREAVICLERIEQYFTNKEKHSERYNYIRTEIVEALGENALDYIQNMDEPPSILAIKVPPKIRYNVLSLLSAEGIQTTWYYYPINRINRYQKYISQEDEGSAEVAGSVVILPFQWRHSDLQVESLAKALRKIKGTL